MSSLPSGIRLVALLNEHLNEIMERERMNDPLILYRTLLGGFRAFGLPAASCVPG